MLIALVRFTSAWSDLEHLSLPKQDLYRSIQRIAPGWRAHCPSVIPLAVVPLGNDPGLSKWETDMVRQNSGMTVVGVFKSRKQAQDAVNELRSAGFREDEIGVIAHDSDEDGTHHEEHGSKAGEGAAVGVATGAGAGALWAVGIAAGMLPAIGPVIAGGVLASILASAAGGAAVAGLAGALVGLGIPEDEADYYETEFHSGRTLVTVKSNRQDDARSIMRRNGAHDIDTEEDASTTSGQKTARGASTATTGDRNIQLREERLRAVKEQKRTGDVRIHKDVVTEHKTMNVPVEREEVVIERRPAQGTRASGGIGEGEDIRIPVKEEEVHVEKRPVVKEEVSVGKRKVTETQRVSGDAKREQLRVDETGDAHVSGSHKTPSGTPNRR